MSEERKFAVLDTNVLVHDPSILTRLIDWVVCIPLYVVMELDVLKNRDEKSAQVRANARDASNFVDGLHQHGDVHSPEGVFHPDFKIVFRVIKNGHNRPIDVLNQADQSMTMDQRILQCAFALKDQEKDHEVHLISFDTNMRILARSEGVTAEAPLTYFAEVTRPSSALSGYHRFHEKDLPFLVSQFYARSAGEIAKSLNLPTLAPNDFLWIEKDEEDLIFRCDSADNHLLEVPRDFPIKKLGVKPKNTEQRMALELLLDSNVKLVSLLGQAGTGKTLLALAAALYQLAHGEAGPLQVYERIVVVRPMVSVGKEAGFLPGDINDKVQPWMRPIQDNLDFLFGEDTSVVKKKGATTPMKVWEHYIDSGLVELQPLSLIRGRTLRNAFVIVDEAQNTTPLEVKTVITRAGEGAKVVLTGDPAQIDQKYLDQESNGLVRAASKFHGKSVAGMVRLRRGERSTLASLAAELL